MFLLFQIMITTGFALLLLASPILAMIALYYAIRQKSARYFIVSALAVFLYLPWMIIEFAVAVKMQWGAPFLGFPLTGIWSGMVALPHLYVWLRGRREKNPARVRAGVFGVAAAIAATAGLMLILYNACA